MADYIIQSETLDNIANAINAKTGGASAMTPAQMVTAIGSISGGASITDGIVITARDANEYATAATLYGTVVQPQQFYNRTTTDGAWKNLTSLSFADTVTKISANAFYNCAALTTLDFSSVTTIDQNGCGNIGIANASLPNLTSAGSNAFIACPSLTTMSLPKLTSINSALLRSCTSLTTVQLGSIGYSVTSLANTAFQNDTQNNLTITIFTNGSYADTAVANARNGATNATIIIKASEATTYNGTSYAAGDTILTSEVTA